VILKTNNQKPISKASPISSVIKNQEKPKTVKKTTKRKVKKNVA